MKASMGRVGQQRPSSESYGEGNLDVRARGASIVQVETLGRLGMVIMLVMFVVIVVIGLVAGYSLGVGEARAENTATQVRLLNAEVKILQSEFNKTQAQLLTQGIIKNTHE